MDLLEKQMIKKQKKFEFSMGEWIIVGLFGRESSLIDALGIYAKPYASIPCPPGRVQMLSEERDDQLAHFLFKVESYSQLLPNEQGLLCESYVFDVAGYKWKLILYPHGNDTCDGKGHISIYLAILESNFTSDDGNNLSVCVDLKFFVFNQNTKKYLVIRDAKGAVLIFNKQKTKQGFSQLLSLDIFKNPSHGYLVNDCCTFGVELLVIQPSSHVEEQTLTSVKDPKGRFESHIVIEEPKGKTYCLQIKNFLELKKDCIFKYFDSVEGIKWQLCIHPKGTKGKFLSLFLRPCAETRKIHMIAKLRVLVPHGVKRLERTVTRQFEELSLEAFGYNEFMPLTDLYEASNEYLKDGTLTVQVKFDEITIRY